MERLRLFLFASLALLGLLLWQEWQKAYAPQPIPDPQQTATQPAAPSGPGEDPSAPPGAPGTSTVAPAASLSQGGGEQIRVRTDLLDVVISTQGGDIRELRLRKHAVSADDPTPFTLMQDQSHPIFIAQSGLQAPDAPAPSHQALFQAERLDYELSAGTDELVVPLSWTDESGIQVTKRYVFRRDSYQIGLQQQVSNESGAPWQGYQYVQLRRTEAESSQNMFFIRTYTGGILHTPEDRYIKLDFSELGKGTLRRDVVDGWLAMIQHYFLAAWIPPQGITYRYYAHMVDGEYVLGASSSFQTIEPGGQASFESRLYAGPKEQERLETVAPDLVLTVDYGMLTIISKPLFWLLSKIHELVGNWGWAIIILTVLIKLAFYKLSETSYRSMARMRTMQPKMQALKERYGDDRQRMNQELMELYKREKINPLGGCLPIVVQIPVFIALYWVLLESVELRQADWILWINDLSARDPYFVLPILMGLSMFVQQRLNPAPMDPVQQKVLMFMPLVFTVFFLFFPAGLVLYWVTNNLLSIAQQWVITRRIEQGAKK